MQQKNIDRALLLLAEKYYENIKQCQQQPAEHPAFFAEASISGEGRCNLRSGLGCQQSGIQHTDVDE